VIKQAPIQDGKTVKVRFVLPQDVVPGKVFVVGDFNGWARHLTASVGRATRRRRPRRPESLAGCFVGIR
jgi:hypothetical protein